MQPSYATATSGPTSRLYGLMGTVAGVLIILSFILLGTSAQAAQSGVSGHRVAVVMEVAPGGPRGALEAELNDLGGGVTHTLGQLPGLVAVEVPATRLSALRSLPRVIDIHPSIQVGLLLDDSIEIVQAAEASFGDAALEGEGRSVAIIDTGVQSDHPFLTTADGSRIVAEACFTISGDCPNGETSQVGPGSGVPLVFDGQEVAHGTHVAGIAVGYRDQADPRRGVAPQADLVAVQIFGDLGGSSPSSTSIDILAALDWVAEVHADHGIAAVNLSLGGTVHSGSCDDVDGSAPVLSAVEQLRSEGVVTVAAGGNSGQRDGLTWPACLSNVVAAGATTSKDAVASFSNVGTELDVVAPGVEVRSSLAGGGYGSLSGTSMSAPQVSGAVALLRQAVPTATAAALLDAVSSSRTTVDDHRTGGTVAGIPRLDVPWAVQSLAGKGVSGAGVDQYLPLVPVRVVDTRKGLGSSASPLAAGEVRSFQVTDVGGVPASGVGAVVLNVTAVGASKETFLTVYPTGEQRPEASTLNPRSGSVAVNEIIAKVGDDGQIEVYNHKGIVDVVLDVVGYLPVAHAFEPLVPVRVVDTRKGLGSSASPLAAGEVRSFQITDVGGVPASGVGAVVMNITAVGATADGFVTVYPKGEQRPETSTLNPRPGSVAVNEVIAKVGDDGQVQVYNHTGSVEVLFDVVGYLPDTADYEPLTPTRILETRNLQGGPIGSPASKIGSGESRSVQVTGVGGVPAAGVGAVVLNVTAVGATANTFVTVYPSGKQRPEASTLNPSGEGPPVANEIIAKVSDGGQVEVYNHSGAVDVIFDVVGYLP